ncbi:unnamed protein product [Mucor hiemalis]
MRPNSSLVDSDSDSLSSAFSDEEYDTRIVNNNNNASGSQQFFAKLVQNTRSKVGQKKSEINATMQEKLPEWKMRGAMYSKQAKDTSIEWSRRGKEAVDRWKKDRADEDGSSRQAQNSENAVFGMPLEVAVALTKIDIDDLIPAVFRRCIEYLNDVGVHEVGIYRIPGSTTTVNKLRAVFNDGSDMDFHTTNPDPHAVGTLLKMYLRELPKPIIPYGLADEYTQQFIASIQTSDEGDKKAMEDTIDVSTSLITAENNKLPPISPSLLKAVHSITSRLPVNTFCLLQILCRHLKKVSDNESENRMSVSNLALIFIPTLNMGRALFHCMVDHYYQVFEEGVDPAGPGKATTITKGIAVKPPPLPQKPRSLSSNVGSNSLPPPPPPPPTKKKIIHSKTMSDTNLILNTSSSTPPQKPKVPPPKPSRSPLIADNKQITGNSNPILNRPRVPIKPRSKSMSSPAHKANINLPNYNNQNDEGDIIWKRSGRVEAIGRQFETLMNQKNK